MAVISCSRVSVLDWKYSMSACSEGVLDTQYLQSRAVNEPSQTVTDVYTRLVDVTYAMLTKPPISYDICRKTYISISCLLKVLSIVFNKILIV